MIVTDKEYFMDKALISKIDMMIKRMQGTDDNVLGIDGSEGQGKTEMATGICYYVSYKTGRKYTMDNIFFDLEKAIAFAGNTKDQIIHIDEGALGLLSIQWNTKIARQFIQLVMTARKKRHFMVICIPKFYKLNAYVVEERMIGLVHIYSRKNLKKGYFVYFTRNALDDLYDDWKRKRKKTYKLHYRLHGTFVMTMDKIFTPEQMREYDRKKDEAIMSIVKEDPDKASERVEKRKEIIKKLIENGKKFGKTYSNKEIGDILGVSEETIRRNRGV